MKKYLKLLITFSLVLGCLFLVTGCDKEEKKGEEKTKKANTTDISYEFGKGKITISVPKNDEGKAKYEFTKEQPKGMSKSASFYLSTDKINIGFLTSGLSYNTSTKYKEKYGETKASFDGYLEFIEDEELFNKSYLPGLEQFKINGRKALRYYNRAGSPGDYNYYGYFYMIGADDIYPGSKFEIVVNYNEEEKPKEAKEIDDETKDIINSIKIELLK